MLPCFTAQVMFALPHSIN